MTDKATNSRADRHLFVIAFGVAAHALPMVLAGRDGSERSPAVMDHTTTSHPLAPSRAEAERMFRRMLAAWVLDCARLRSRGIDRPAHRPATTAGPRARTTAATPLLLREG